MSHEQPSVLLPSGYTQQKKIVLSIIGIFFLVIVAVLSGLMVYKRFFVIQKPDVIINNVIQLMRAVQTTSYHTVADVVVSAESENFFQNYNVNNSVPWRSTTSTAHVEINGDIDRRDSSAVKSAIQVSVKLEPDDSTVLTHDAEGIVVGDLQFVKFNTIPPVDYFDSTILKKDWIRFNKKDVNEMDLFTMIAGTWGDNFLLYQNFGDQIPYLIERLFTDPRVIKDKMTREIVDRTSVYRLPYVLHEKDLENILMTITNAASTQSKSSQIYSNMNKNFSEIEVNGDVWVDAKNYYPLKISVHFAMKQENSQIFNNKGSIVIHFDSFNDSLNIVPPQSSTTPQALSEYFDINVLISSMLRFDPAYNEYVKQSQDPTFKRNEKRFKDLNQLLVALELYRNGNYEYPRAPIGIVLGTSSTICLNLPMKNEEVSGFTSLDSCHHPIMNVVPGDPLPGSTYLYTTDNVGTVYTIEAFLEGDYEYRNKNYSGKIHATPRGIIDVQ